MDAQLLASRIHIPPAPLHLVHRARVVEALERDVRNHKLTLISAPAGFGKTTLLAQWARSTALPVAWVTIGHEGYDAERLVRSLFGAWQVCEPDVRASPLGILLEGAEPNIESVRKAFIDVTNDIPDHTVFVLDDFNIDDPATCQTLSFLIEHFPPKMHFVLAGRSDPPLSLSRYRAHQELVEYRSTELQFDRADTEEFLNQLADLQVDDQEIDRLHSQLDGWPAGIQLAALTLQRHRTADSLQAVSGATRFISDYLSDEVLAGTDQETRHFLLETCICESLCAGLCNALTGNQHSQLVLETLERSNLFLAPLDGQRQWFRFHPIFSSFLRQELNRQRPGDVKVLHRRASEWFLRHDLPESAFYHAVAADDPDLTVAIGNRFIFEKLACAEYAVVKQCLAEIPVGWYASHPMFAIGRVGLLIFTGQFEMAFQALADAEHWALAGGAAQQHALARITAIRCFVACIQNDLAGAEELASQALEALPEDDHDFRSGVHGSLGDLYRANGRWEDARSRYLEALKYTKSPVAQIQFANVFSALADMDLMRGRLRNADTNWKKALAIMQDPARYGTYPLPAVGWVYLRVAELLYERNDLNAARDHLSWGRERAAIGGDLRSLIAAHITAARLSLAQAEVVAALESLDSAREMLIEAPFPDLISQINRLQLETWLAADQLRSAADWSDRMQADEALLARPEKEVTQMAVARLLIFKGDPASRHEAMLIVEQLLLLAEHEGRLAIEIEGLALQAIARQASGDEPGAMTSLEHALRLAEPEGYVRRFVDLGLPIARLLQEARSRGVMPAYVARLLAAFGGDSRGSKPGVSIFPEPLSAREHEVLELMAAGLTNREIADSLTISPQTVKKHADNIYGKLGVRGRTQAAARARETGLLG